MTPDVSNGYMPRPTDTHTIAAEILIRTMKGILEIMIMKVLFTDCRSPNNQSIVGEYNIQYHTCISAREYARSLRLVVLVEFFN